MEIKQIPLTAGARYTIYSCSDSAMTTRQEVTVTRVLPTPEFRPAYVNSTRGCYRLGTFKISRKRSEYYLDLKLSGTLIIPGWNTGVLADHEAHSSFAMSATMNLAASPESIRELIAKNINPNFSQHDRVIAYPEPLIQMVGEQGILVYPEAETDHAVILRMREKLQKSDA